MPPLFAGSSGDRTPRRRWTDRIVGIAVGIVLGLGVLVYFVFVHSEGTIDAPSIKGTGSGKSIPGEGEPGSTAQPGPSAATAGGKPGQGEFGGGPRGGATKPSPKVPVVRVIGGAPPTDSGPKKLTFHKGEKVSFEIATNEPFSFEIRGLGITKSIQSSSIISFKATKAGQFPVISTTTLIGVADLLIKK